MPSKHSPAASGGDRPSFESVAAAIGEDPARYLCADLSVRPIIRGMRDAERAAAWLAVARNIGADEEVRRLLERKRDALRNREGEGDA